MLDGRSSRSRFSTDSSERESAQSAPAGVTVSSSRGWPGVLEKTCLDPAASTSKGPTRTPSREPATADAGMARLPSLRPSLWPTWRRCRSGRHCSPGQSRTRLKPFQSHQSRCSRVRTRQCLPLRAVAGGGRRTGQTGDYYRFRVVTGGDHSSLAGITQTITLPGNNSEVGQLTVCQHCGKEFLPSRKDARFCGGTCRVASHRKAGKMGSEGGAPINTGFSAVYHAETNPEE